MFPKGYAALRFRVVDSNRPGCLNCVVTNLGEDRSLIIAATAGTPSRQSVTD